jgi:hypothetical protein
LNATAETILNRTDLHFDVLYIDPSRRETKNKAKVFLLEDMTPNILFLQKYFYKIANKTIIKLSPMFDISAAIEQIENVSEVHIVSVDNECKELLLVCDNKNIVNEDNIFFVGVNFICDNNLAKDISSSTKHIKSVFKQTQLFEYNQSNSNKMIYAASLDKYLFEPNSSIMKLACWSELCRDFSVSKLATNTNLFTANEIKKRFPGFIYEIIDVVKYDKKAIAEIVGKNNGVSIKCRNFPDVPDEVRKKLKLNDGNDYYLFCTTLKDNSLKVIVTSKLCN